MGNSTYICRCAVDNGRLWTYGRECMLLSRPSVGLLTFIVLWILRRACPLYVGFPGKDTFSRGRTYLYWQWEPFIMLSPCSVLCRLFPTSLKTFLYFSGIDTLMLFIGGPISLKSFFSLKATGILLLWVYVRAGHRYMVRCWGPSIR